MIKSIMRSRFTAKFFFCLSGLGVVLWFASCGQQAQVPFFFPSSGAEFFSVLLPLSGDARKGRIRGGGSALFAFPAAENGGTALASGALEVSLEIRGAGSGESACPPADIRLAFLTQEDFLPAGKNGKQKLKRRISEYREQSREDDFSAAAHPFFGTSAVLSGGSGRITVRLAVPADGAPAAGFVLAVSAPDETETCVLDASVQQVSSGWLSDTGPGKIVWAGFGEDGGCRVLSFDPGDPPPVSVPDGHALSVLFFPAPVETTGVSAGQLPAVQHRTVFTDGVREFGFRLSPSGGLSVFQPLLLKDFSGTVRPVSGGGYVRGIFTSPAFPEKAPAFPDSALPGSSLLDPVTADPHAMIEWPQSAWRRPDREIFRWDRFPSVLVFDTADYGVQNRYFRRLAFFVEKQGYRGRLLSDRELAGMHAYNAHDYRAESLAEFFSAAAASGFPLLDEELELRGILLRSGILRASADGGFLPGEGAVISMSRSSPLYLRYSFMAHEGFHAVYFTDAGFRETVRRVYAAADPRAVGFLQDYFYRLDTLGYDITDSYLMENEFMGYLMQNRIENTADYFAENLTDRYLRYGGNRELAAYVKQTSAADFTAAAEALSRYTFGRWGILAGRVGLQFWDD